MAASTLLCNMVKLNFSTLPALLAYYDLKSVAYKPTFGLHSSLSTSAVPSPGRKLFVRNDVLSAPVSHRRSKSLGQRRKEERTIVETLDVGGFSCSSEQVYDPLPIGSQIPPPFDETTAYVYRYRQQQSVNLGSWYVTSHQGKVCLRRLFIFIGLYMKSG